MLEKNKPAQKNALLKQGVSIASELIPTMRRKKDER